MIGMKIPPARAVVEGMAGAITVSAADSPYASPSVDLPATKSSVRQNEFCTDVFLKGVLSVLVLEKNSIR